MDNFTASKKNARLHFVALFEKPDDVVLLELVVVFIRVGPKLHFLDDNVFLMFFCFVKFLVHLVEVLSIIHDSANRGIRSGSDLYQVQTALFSDP